MADYQGPLSDLPALLVRSCDGCGGTMFLDPSRESECRRSDSTFGVYILCGKCQTAEDRREAAVTVQVHTRCVHRGYPGGPFSDLAVTAADGDQVTVCVIGLGPLPLAEQNVILGRAGVPAWFQERRTWPRSELLMRGL